MRSSCSQHGTARVTTLQDDSLLEADSAQIVSVMTYLSLNGIDLLSFKSSGLLLGIYLSSCKICMQLASHAFIDQKCVKHRRNRALQHTLMILRTLPYAMTLLPYRTHMRPSLPSNKATGSIITAFKGFNSTMTSSYILTIPDSISSAPCLCIDSILQGV